MDSEKYLIVIVFFAYGIFVWFKPDFLVRYQVWANKVILGAKFVPSKRTYKMYRYIGLLFIVTATALAILLFGA